MPFVGDVRFARELHDYIYAIFEHSGSQELVTELVSRHVVVTCFRVLSELPTGCNPRL